MKRLFTRYKSRLRSHTGKDFSLRPAWNPKHIGDLRGQRFLVTGANSGIGYSTSLELARRGASVVLACRNPQKLEETMSSLQGSIPGALLEPLLLDLASFRSIDTAVKEELKKELPLNVLINNAGVMAPPKRLLTEDGYELQFGVNILGHFVLTQKLLPCLESAESARVVNVASIAHRRGELKFHDLQWEQNYNPRQSYAQSKLANLMFSLELERRLRNSNSSVSSIACHPGVANTRLFTTGDYGLCERLVREIVSSLIGWVLNSQWQGSLPSLFSATSDFAKGGGYYGPQGFREMRGGDVGIATIEPQAKKLDDSERLWNICEELTGTKFLSG